MAKVLWRSTLGASGATSESYSDGPFQDTNPSTGSTPLPLALSQDIARSFRQLGVASFRASVVNVDTMTFQAAWTISEQGEITDSQVDRPLDSSFPAATAAINLLAHANDEETLLHKLSPRRWGVAWRLDDPNVVLAEAQFHERRDAISESDKTLLRLVCSAAMRPPGAAAAGPDATAAMVWQGADAAGAAQAPRLEARLAVVLSALTVLLGLWLAAGALPELKRVGTQREEQLAQLQALSDKTLVRGVGTALATGDYGDTQTALSSYASLGYFEGAAVVNVRQRVVALAGKTDQLRIGDPVPDDTLKQAQVIELALGADKLGQLLVLPAPPAAGSGGVPGWIPPLAWATAGAALAALAAAAAALRRPKPPRQGA